MDEFGSRHWRELFFSIDKFKCSVNKFKNIKFNKNEHSKDKAILMMRGNHLGKNDNFLHFFFKCHAFDIFLIFKWQFSGGSEQPVACKLKAYAF